MSYIKVPGDIEKRSFEIIEEELGDKVKKFSESEMPIVKRIIHTSADFEYADLIELVETQKMTDKVIDKMTDKNKERVKLLMKYLDQNDSISNKEAQSLLGISEATARRFLNSLVKENLLVAVGEYKARKYIKK